MPKTVLIVDDSPTMRHMVADTLCRAGFAVVEGVNGTDALAKLDGRAVQLVITDFNMPVNVQSEHLNVGAKNAAFVLSYLQAEGIPVDGQCLGETSGLIVRFHPHTGRASARPLAVARRSRPYSGGCPRTPLGSSP